jgi:hypothetical protein
MTIDYNNTSLDYIKEVYPDLDQYSLDFLNELDQKVLHLHKAQVPLELIRYLLRYDFTPERVNASYKKQKLNSAAQTTFLKLEDCFNRGLTAKEASMELRLTLNTVKYSYAFNWPKEKTHSSSGQLLVK